MPGAEDGIDIELQRRDFVPVRDDDIESLRLCHSPAQRGSLFDLREQRTGEEG